MTTLEQMLQKLARPGVTELALAGGRLPCVKVDGRFEPVDQAARSNEAILAMLREVGGGAHVDGLSARPSQWTLTVAGVGVITAAAVQRDGTILARFVVTKPETAGPSAPAVGPSAPAVGPSAPAVDPSTPTAGPNAPAAPPAPPAPPGVTPPRAPAAHVAPAKIAAPAGSGSPKTPTSRAAPANPGAPTSPHSSTSVYESSVNFDLESPPHHVAPQHGHVLFAKGVHPAPTSLDPILAAARDAAASDVHLVAERPLLLRIAGELVPTGAPLDAARVERILSPRIPSRCLVPLERDGSCDFALEIDGIGRFRANVTKQRTGLKACFRVIPPDVPTLASLGLPEDIAKATHHHQGLIVVTGPTGHGKTSTLAAIIDIINRETTHHVITVEDPIEHVHPQKRAVISQREIGTHTLSFQNALKASLREDPDVIVVGELRDTETVRMALSASETGHLVLGTMNTPSAAKTIDRLIDLFPPGDQQQVRMTLAGGLRLIVSQRLLPTPDRSRMVAAAELLPGSVALWSLIRDNKTFQIPSLQQRGKGFGIIRLDDSLAELVIAGKTTLEAALAVAESPENLLRAAGKKA